MDRLRRAKIRLLSAFVLATTTVFLWTLGGSLSNKRLSPKNFARPANSLPAILSRNSKLATTPTNLDGHVNRSGDGENVGTAPRIRDVQIAPRPTEFGILTLEKVRRAALSHINLRKHVVLFSNYEEDMARCEESTDQNIPKDKDPTNLSECFGTPAITVNYSTCALVGNGGILLNSSCGEAVDSHDFVIRLNLPPVQSFERDVGSRTDLVSINNKVLIDVATLLYSSTGKTEVLKMLKQVENSILLYAKGFEKRGKGDYNITTLQALKSVEDFIISNGLQIRTAYGISDDVQAASKRVISRLRETVRHPTTGFLNYFLSLAFCRHVTVYGFWPFEMTSDHRPLPYHYHDNGAFPFVHEIVDEQVFLRDLNETGCLTLVKDCM